MKTSIAITVLALLPVIARAEDPAALIRARLAPAFVPPAENAGDFGEFRSPLKFADGRNVRPAADWATRRTEILRSWQERLGPWPALLDKPRIEIRGTSSCF